MSKDDHEILGCLFSCHYNHLVGLAYLGFCAAMIPLSHLPTLFLLLGYPIFWMEMWFLRVPGGHTSYLATALLLVTGGCILWRQRQRIFYLCPQNWGGFNLPLWFLVAAAVGCLVIIATAFLASLLPPHLLQEYDALNYHITLPRQHLLMGSFAHLSWSVADLFLAPVSFALAPFWLVTEWPNKVPQFFFVLGLAFVAGRLAWRFSQGRSSAALLAGVMIFSCHVVGIQFGTAMLDLVLCYLFWASVDSYYDKRYVLAALEFTFFLWSKPLMPVLMGSILVVMVIIMLLRRVPVNSKKLLLVGSLIFVLSIPIAGPFMVKSWQVARTPLYPVTMAALQNSDACRSGEGLAALDQVSCSWRNVGNVYGHGKTWDSFLKHFWLLSVPEKGVNNSFDYPLGLVYLLILGPFVAWFVRGKRSDTIWPLGAFCLLYWLFWWMGTQQSRFLMVPLAGMIIITAATLQRFSRVFLACVLFGLFFTSASIFRAHRVDFGHSAGDVLREQDKNLLQQGQVERTGRIVDVSFPDAAFAAFPVNVTAGSADFVLK